MNATSTTPMNDNLTAEYRAAEQRKFEEHQSDMAHRQREIDERCPIEEKMRLCNPKYAAIVEDAKTRFKYRVTAMMPEVKKPQVVKSRYDDFDATEEDYDRFSLRTRTGIVEAQNEDDAWAMFCDRIQEWPSRKLAKPKFEIIEQTNPPADKPKQKSTKR